VRQPLDGGVPGVFERAGVRVGRRQRRQRPGEQVVPGRAAGDGKDQFEGLAGPGEDRAFEPEGAVRLRLRGHRRGVADRHLEARGGDRLVPIEKVEPNPQAVRRLADGDHLVKVGVDGDPRARRGRGGRGVVVALVGRCGEGEQKRGGEAGAQRVGEGHGRRRPVGCGHGTAGRARPRDGRGA
jgi:hypothetical protein